MSDYPAAVKRQMVRFYVSLNERDRRRYAAVEAQKLGHGGIHFISELLKCDPKTIAHGIQGLEAKKPLTTERQRKKGAGRKPLTQTFPQLVDNLLAVLKDHTAGDPMREEVKWTNLSRRDIFQKLKERGTPADKNVVSQLLRELGFRRRKPQKNEYGSYCSKYNPIEHRVFPHVTRACKGAPLETIEVAKHYIEKAKTATGLSVTVRILDKAYETGRKYAKDFKEKMTIRFDEFLPSWNYTAVPMAG